MTYTIPPGSPRSATAAEFGAELVRACAARGIPRSELWRSTGIGRTAMDNYRTGSSLPRTATAAVLAEALRWPRLLAIAVAARTHNCRRCGRPFRNEGGNQFKRYCTVVCRRLAVNEAQASRRLRQAGQTDDNRRRYQAVALLRSGIRIADQRAAGLQAAIDAMCASCEPGGTCRVDDCPLRAFSPLPLAQHDVGQPRTIGEVRAAAWTDERRVGHSEMAARRWARPGEREAQAARSRVFHESMTEAERAAWRATVGLAQKTKRERSTIARKGAATRRARRAIA